MTTTCGLLRSQGLAAPVTASSLIYQQLSVDVQLDGAFRLPPRRVCSAALTDSGILDRRLAATIGDGSFQYSVQALYTAAQHRLPIVFVAAYFRAALTDERQTVTAALDQAKTRLRACVERQEVMGLRGMARARFQVRELEHQVHELDRMIAALDQRYTPSWSDRR